MHSLAQRLWPFPRSLTGNGVRQTLNVLGEYLPGLTIHEVPSGTPVFDWVVPDEWNITEAYLIDPLGNKVIDFENSNVHVVSYSEPVDCEISLEGLQTHLHSDPELPDAIPYVTSYYNRTWGFCLTQKQRDALIPGTYRAVIKSTLAPGSLTYGEFVIPGQSPAEVFISAYVCHPSLANNELSGPVVATAVARWLLTLDTRKFTYRFVFIPETIGAVTYVDANLEHLRSHVVAGFNLTCIGDEGDYSYLASRHGNTPIDRIARRVVSQTPKPVIYSYLDRGSDERQYCAPGIDLPLISLMRTKYGEYPEYHTSLDNLDFVTPAGLQGGFELVRDCITELEASTYLQTPIKGEPQLGKRGLYHTMHARTVADEVLLRTHILAYSDGAHSVADIAELTGRPISDIETLTTELHDHGLVEYVNPRVVRD
jgi:aminopeptidase-like protein